MKYILTFDVGTTNIKGVLYGVEDNKFSVIKTDKKSLNLIINDKFVEQDTNEWWSVIKEIIYKLTEDINIKENIIAIGFCSQMLCLVSLDKDFNQTRNAINYMDDRVEKINIFKNLFTIIYSIINYKIGSVSSKDIIHKIKWLKKYEKDNYNKTYKFMDASDYFSNKLTGKYLSSNDNAYVTFMYNPDQDKWDDYIINSYDLDKDKLCNPTNVSESKGIIRNEIADELNLPKNIKVYSGGDVTCIAYSACFDNDINTHIYWGTSGWVSSFQNKRYVDVLSSSTSLISAKKNNYNFMGQIETTGKSLDYILNLLDLNYNNLKGIYNRTKVGANGVYFTPWISGERTPFTNTKVRSSFTGINLETNKDDLLRAVIEGICLEYYWELEIINKHIEPNDKIYFNGGGANSEDICQILSDVIGKEVIVKKGCQFEGNYGIAKIICDDQNISISENNSFIIYEPNLINHEKYIKMLKKFKKLRKI